MNDKYVIQVFSSQKWLNLDFHDGSNLIYVDTFLQALPLNTKEEAFKFVKDHGLKIEDCELFKLKIFAQCVNWDKALTAPPSVTGDEG